MPKDNVIIICRVINCIERAKRECAECAEAFCEAHLKRSRHDCPSLE